MHIEPTSRCTLACPGCPRTWFVKKFQQPFPKQDLDLDQLERFMDCESGNRVSEFLLNGNHGDPIYYPYLLDMIDRFRSKQFKISTNGSYQSLEFWSELKNRLTSKDTVYFSIDGLEHNNHLYRRNSDWTSIMQALDIMVQSPARIVWKTIVFSYNSQEINQMRRYAEDRGAIFISETTSRFGDESLKPSEELIDILGLYEKTTELSVLAPRCSELEYISADGYYWPCCMMTSMYSLHKTELWNQRSKWSIDSQNLDQARVQLNEWKKNILDYPEKADAICRMNCKPGQKSQWATM